MNIMSEDEISTGFATIWLMLFIPVIYIWLAQGVKRCHDLGHSGWWLLIPFYIFAMWFQEGDRGSNEYGDNPKGE